MKNRRHIIYLLPLLFFLSSCSSHTSKYYMVQHHQPRKSSLGFSIVPPPGENWYEKLKNDSLLYVKIGDSIHSYSILTEAREVHLPQQFQTPAEFLSYVREEKEKLLSQKTHMNSDAEYHIEKRISDFCIRYQYFYEDHGTPALKGRRHVNVNTSGLLCRHPDNFTVAIDLSYMEKSLSGMKATSYRNEGEIFLSSLSFQSKI